MLFGTNNLKIVLTLITKIIVFHIQVIIIDIRVLGVEKPI